ncbi:MAG TPA: superinfection immunity protein [Streptosporangiaceae bacterium]
MVRALVIIAFLAAWFLPLIIAALYKLPHQGPIAVLSLALGWTGVGWLAALVITIGGAIRATRPALAGQEQPQAAGAGQAYAPAQAAWGPSSTGTAQFPAGAERPAGGGQYPPGAPYPDAQPPEQAQGQERAPSPERPPSRWPDSPR